MRAPVDQPNVPRMSNEDIVVQMDEAYARFQQSMNTIRRQQSEIAYEIQRTKDKEQIEQIKKTLQKVAQ